MDIIIKESGVRKPPDLYGQQDRHRMYPLRSGRLRRLTNGSFTVDEGDRRLYRLHRRVQLVEGVPGGEAGGGETLFALCNEFGEAAVSQLFMEHQHLLNTDAEHEHEAMERIFDLIRTQLSQPK